MDKKFDNDKRPTIPRLVSSFDEPHAGDGTFTGEPTIPGAYGSLPGLSAHDSGLDAGAGYGHDLADLIDPTLDGTGLGGQLANDTLDHEYVDFTQTDLQAISDTDSHETHGRLEMRGLLLDCLGVIDEVERVIEFVTSAREGQDDAVVTGLAAVRDGFLDKLAAYGVEREACVNTAYDPDLHEIAREETVAEGEREGIIISVERAGYTRDGHPLRRAHVVVGKKN